jgi:hypothetical protein
MRGMQRKGFVSDTESAHIKRTELFLRISIHLLRAKIGLDDATVAAVVHEDGIVNCIESLAVAIQKSRPRRTSPIAPPCEYDNSTQDTYLSDQTKIDHMHIEAQSSAPI